MSPESRNSLTYEVNNMWKKSLLRGLSSYCISATVYLMITAVILLCGAENACMPEFIQRAGSVQLAVCLHQLLIALIGFACGAGSVLFEMERWSLLKQGAAHLACTLAVWVVVYRICFFPITPPVVTGFSVSALISYAITWSAQYFVWRGKVRTLNEQIHRRNEANHEERR